ncbi:MAG: cell division protein FtsQ [Solirubrobacteraceae bacterium]|nr:cell division protein FtsQ [Solirubrobacteraceae bacterium]
MVLLAVLAGGGWLWLRDSSLVSVRRVQITGLTGPDANKIRSVLDAAARNQSTLHVRRDALLRALAPFPIVKDLRVHAHPPHALDVDVIEHDPVGAVLIGGRAVPFAPDGTLLRELPAPPDLARISAGGTAGPRITDPHGRRAVALLAAAPAPLRTRIDRVRLSRAHGLVAVLRNGPALYFGSSDRLPAKWTAAAAVLADRGSAGARYIDLRVPARPAAGGLPPSPEAAAAAAKGTDPTAPTVSAPGASRTAGSGTP